MSEQALSGLSAMNSPAGADAGLAHKVDVSPLQSTPFDYIYMEGVFSPDQYRDLMGNLPDSSSFHQLRHDNAMRADGSSTRLRLYLYPENLRNLPPAQQKVWLGVSQALMSSTLQDAFKRKFRAALEKRFQKSIDRLNFYPIPILVRDLPGYRIGVHSDSLRKAITVQFYLPRDASQEHLGTTFHESDKGPGFDKTTTMKFLPASGYAFPVNKTSSWHSVVGTKDADGVRNSLMLTYYVQSDFGLWLKWRRQRLNIFLGRPPKN